MSRGHTRARVLSCLLMLCTCLIGCHNTPGPDLDVIPPQVFATPAGGIFHQLPSHVVLESSEDTIIYYTLDGSRPTLASQSYREPIELIDNDVTLRFITRDAAGNVSQAQVERYRQVKQAPQITLRPVTPRTLGPQQTTTVTWVCEQHCGDFRLTAAGGWESGVQLHAGTVQAGQEVHSTIAASRLPQHSTRLWVQVKSDQGVFGAASLPLTIDRQPPQVYAWPGGGTYGTLPTVTLVADETATIYYTTDGSAPTSNAAIYKSPLVLRHNTTLRFLASDRFGNRGTLQTEDYRLQPQGPTIQLQQFPGAHLDVSTTLRLAWSSSHHGRYVLSANGQPLLRGRVARHKPMQSIVHGWSLQAPRTRLLLRVTDDGGREGSASFVLDLFFRDTFARQTTLDGEATTALQDTATGRITLPTGPLLAGMYDTNHTTRGVAQEGSYAYVANTRGGLQVVDVSAPSHPQPVGNLNLYGEPKALAKYQHYVYLAADSSGVQIFDVTEPQAPLLVGQQSLPGRASALTIRERRLYVGTREHGLYLYDLSQPRRLKPLAHLALEMPIMHLAATATHVYIAGFQAGVAIVDVTMPAAPRLLTTLPIWPRGEAVLGVAIHDQRLYVAAGTLSVFDVQDAAHPQPLAQMPLRSAHGLAIHHGRLYVAEQYHGLRVIDATATQPVILGTYDTPNRAVRVILQGHLAFVADMLGGLQIIDVSHPEQPRLLHSLTKLGQIVDVWVEGGFAYLANRQGRVRLLVADVRHPGQARIVGSYRNGSLIDVATSGPLAYTLDAFGGLQVLDINRLPQPQLLGAYQVPGVAQGLTLYGSYALVAAGAAGLQVINVAQASQPALVASLALDGESVDVVTWGPYAYVAAGTGGIATVDLTHPDSPRLLGRVRPPEHGEEEKILRLAVGNAYLYASDSASNLLVFSLLSPPQPQLLHQITHPQGSLWALLLHGRYLYATTILKHLTIFDLADPTTPRVLGGATSGARDLALTAPYLLLGTEAYRRRGGGLRVVDIYAPHPPHLRATWHEETFDVTTRGTYVYSVGEAGLLLGRFASAKGLQRHIVLPWPAQRLTLCGPWAYVGGQQGLAVVDITAPAEPRLLSTLQLDSPVTGLVCTGNFLYLAAGRDGLLVVDIRTPAQPVLRASIPISSDLRHVLSWGAGYLLGGGADGTLTLFDLSRPSQPAISARLDLQRTLQDLVIYGRHAYAAMGVGGLHVIALQTDELLRTGTVWNGDARALALWGQRLYVVDGSQGLVSFDLSASASVAQRDVIPLPSSSKTTSRLIAGDTALFLAQGEYGLQHYTMASSRTAVRVPQAIVQSLAVDTATHTIATATLLAQAWSTIDGHITYELSNDGGTSWAPVLPGVAHHFSSSGHDLRWRAGLHGTSPGADPTLYEVQLTYTLVSQAP